MPQNMSPACIFADLFLALIVASLGFLEGKNAAMEYLVWAAVPVARGFWDWNGPVEIPKCFILCMFSGKKNVQTVEEFSPMSFLFLSLGKQDRNGAEGKITPKLKVRHPLKAVFS